MAGVPEKRSDYSQGTLALHHLDGGGLDLQVDAGNIGTALLLVVAGALAEFSKTDVPALAQFQAGGDHHAVNINAGLPLELEQHIHGAGIVCSAAENPAATAEDCAGEGLD